MPLQKSPRSKPEIPNGWRLVRLEDIAMVNPRRSRLEIGSQTPVTFIPMAAVGEDCSGILARECREYSEVSKGYTYFQENDVLFAKITPCLQNGKHALATQLNTGFGFGTTEFHVLRAKDVIEPRHLYRVITQPANIEKCTRSFTGTAGQQRVQPETIKSLSLLLPPLPEQRAIAGVLDSIDEAKEKTEAVVAATENLRDALLHRLLTRGVPGWHSEWKEVRGIGTMPADWDVVRLGEVATFLQGGTPSKRRSEYWDGEIPFVTGADLRDVRIDRFSARSFLTLQGLNSGHTAVCEEGSLLLATRTRVGLVGIASEIMGASQDITLVKPSDSIETEFLCRSLVMHAPWLGLISRGTTIQGVSREDVSNLRICLPSLNEQHVIVQMLNGIDEAVERGRAETVMLQSLKASAADALLTGRVRVNTKLDQGADGGAGSFFVSEAPGKEHG